MNIVYRQKVYLMQCFFAVWALITLSLASCTNDKDMPDNDRQGNGQEVSLTIPLKLSGIETQKGKTYTRSVGNKEAIQVQWGETFETTTRADSDKTSAEMKINSLYMLQFDGTTNDAAKLLQCVKLTVPVLAGGSGSVSCTFKLSASGSPVQTVYLVANVDLSSYVNNTTLTKSTFLSSVVKFNPTTSVPATGLPYVASNEFDPMTFKQSTDVFTLKAMVTKLTYTLKMDALMTNYLKGSFGVTLRQVADGTVYKEPIAWGAAYPSSGVSRNGSLSLGKLAVTGSDAQLQGIVYLPENIAGQTTGITDDTQRGKARAKAGATCLELSGEHIDGKTVTYSLFLGEPTNPNDFNVKRNYEYNVTATIMGVSASDERVVKDKFINLSLVATANCYIVTGANSNDYGFDATVRGNNATGVAGIGYSSLPALFGATEARVIWQTGGATSVVKSVRLEDGHVIFTTGTATEGNAVIGIFASSAANAPCLWSWHIWRLNSVPEDLSCVKTPSPASAPANFEMMDRYLGATDRGEYYDESRNAPAIGLLYQWGRKDPFPGPQAFNTNERNDIFGSFNNNGTTGTWNGTYSIKTTASSSTVGTEAWAVKYPTAFITSNGGDWMYIQNDNLWGTPWVATGSVGGRNGSQGTKSIYDPCPAGYRVPPHDFASKVGYVRDFLGGVYLNGIASGEVWFSLAGRRLGSNGVLNSASSNGNCWTSSPSAYMSGMAGDMYYYSGSVSSVSSNNRSVAFQVRCVSE